MFFSLFECQDGTFVVVPQGLAPPVEAFCAHGRAVHVSDRPRLAYDCAIWDDVSRRMDRALYVAVHPDVAFFLFALDDESV
jgi:hypothetical protein